MDKKINQSEIKNQSKCPYYKKCNGCQLQNLSYTEQLQFKQKKVNQLLDKFIKPNQIIGMDNPTHYRNKVQWAFGMTRDKKLISGIYKSSTNTIVPIKQCLIEDKIADKIINSIKDIVIDLEIVPYNEFNGKGLLRHILVKRGFATNEIMVVFVGISPIFPQKKMFVEKVLKIHPEINTIVFNINSDKQSMLLGEKEQILYGKGYIEDILCGLKFKISAKSFYQINPIQTEILYNKAIEYASLTGNELVLDAYCGIGTIGLIASKKAKQVLGVEINKDAIKDAIKNAKLNDVKNINFVADDAGKLMTQLASENEKCDVVFLDPPRAGCDNKFLTSVIKLSSKKIVYISCNPETLARDLEFLTHKGYVVDAIQPVDMFPHTNHIECCVLLSSKK